MIPDKIRRLLDKLPRRSRQITVTVILALAAALIAVAFHVTIHAIFEHGILALSHQSTARFLLGSFLIMGVASGLAGWLLSSFCPEAAGSGLPQVKLAFWRDFGAIPWRVVWVKFIGGALSVGGGNSLGREGPSVQMSAGLASNLAPHLGVPKHLGRSGTAAGAAAGLAASFNTPIAAVTFVLEEIVGDLNSRLLGVILLASVLGALVAHGLLGSQPAFVLTSHGAPDWKGYVLTPLVAVMATVLGCYLQRGALGLRLLNKRPSRYPAWVRVMAGGLVVWAIGSAVFLWTGHLGVFGLGYDDLTEALRGDMFWQLAAILLIAKLLATVVCYGLGGCGGVFAPTLFFGAMTGAVVSQLVGLATPLTTADHVTLAVAGMCACLGGVVRAPVTGILIVFELTHEFSLVPALLIAALISLWVAHRMNHRNFYDEILAQDGQDAERYMTPRNLSSWMELPADRVANYAPVMAGSAEPSELRSLFAEHRHDRFPVVEGGALRGVVDRRAFLAAEASGQPVRVEEAVVCLPATPLREVKARLVESTSHMAVVMDRVGEGARVVAVLTLHDMLRAQLLLSRDADE